MALGRGSLPDLDDPGGTMFTGDCDIALINVAEAVGFYKRTDYCNLLSKDPKQVAARLRRYAEEKDA